MSYTNFVNTFTTVLDKYCPVQEVKIIDVNKNKPWFTNGLLNACKKKKYYIHPFLSIETKNLS